MAKRTMNRGTRSRRSSRRRRAETKSAVESAEATRASRRFQIAQPRTMAVKTNRLIPQTSAGAVGVRITTAAARAQSAIAAQTSSAVRSEEHTSELQSRVDISY